MVLGKINRAGTIKSVLRKHPTEEEASLTSYRQFWNKVSETDAGCADTPSGNFSPCCSQSNLKEVQRNTRQAALKRVSQNSRRRKRRPDLFTEFRDLANDPENPSKVVSFKRRASSSRYKVLSICLCESLRLVLACRGFSS